ncbi:MAG: MoaD/ThiS family protein [Thermaerobacter sp.]|nr:MoaD/ThiS family protein [Thermaerobacter sp.]
MLAAPLNAESDQVWPTAIRGVLNGTAIPSGMTPATGETRKGRRLVATITATVSVLFFSFAADRMQRREAQYAVTEGTRLDTFYAEHLASALRAPLTAWMFSANQEWVAGDYLIRDGDELAVIPPVSGG